MRHVFILMLFVLMFPSLSFAQDAQSTALKQVFQFSKNKKPAEAKSYLTPRSHELYDRIYKHNLLFLIPSSVEANKNQVKNGFHYVQFSDPAKPSKQSVIMAFQGNAAFSKLDLPETFRIGFGEDWPKKIDMIEQSYLFSKQYYGEQKSAQMVEALMKAGK